MTFDVEVHGRLVRVGLSRTASGWSVTVNDRTAAVDAVQIGPTLSLLIGPPDSARTSYTAAVEARARGAFEVQVGGEMIALAVRDPRGAWSRRDRDDGVSASGPTSVVAPMPGRVVRILVEPGAAVTARQGLVVVEAMKMENELRSPKDGTVAEVRVTEGTSVEAGTVLVVVE